jgi:hypothetical protein
LEQAPAAVFREESKPGDSPTPIERLAGNE